jgi:Tol biopolymer transport system component
MWATHVDTVRDAVTDWSPDGTQIVFCSGRGDSDSRDIWIVDVDRSGMVAPGVTWGSVKADFR